LRSNIKPMSSSCRVAMRSDLERLLGQDSVYSDEIDRLAYSVDYYWVPRMIVDRNASPAVPDFVVLPRTVEEVSAVVRLAGERGVPIIPWGGGSGSQGGIIPACGGITLDVKRLNRIMNLNEATQTVIAQAGISGYVLECALNRRGYTLPHYPASVHSATLGGYLACRGSGVLSTRYGKAEDMVLSVQVVLPDGDIIRTLPFPNHAAGPGLLQLFVGSEGTYGIITEAVMQVERLPEERRFVSFLFGSLAAGLEAGRRIMLERIGPSVMRLYDESSTHSRLNRILGLSLNGVFMVVGMEGRGQAVNMQESWIREICLGLKGEELSSDLGWEWWRNRYHFYFPPGCLDFPWMFGTMDSLCGFDDMENLYQTKKKILEETYKRWDLRYIAHFSHWYPWGVMIYDRFIIEEPPLEPEEALALHNEIWELGVRTSLACGGILNEHHGVGLKLSGLMREQYGSAFQVLEGVKNALDPRGVMNPGKLGFAGAPPAGPGRTEKAAC
jgi:alkyldihydroxyacetonephosphate synthase